ncbi:MAG: hypothetical protein AAF529_12325 [Pseudomonadota bacterium]
MQMQTFKLIGFLATVLTINAHAAESPFAGHWKVNLEETDKVTETFEEGSGAGRAKILQNSRISVSGLPMPTLRTRVPPMSGMSPKNPDVLLCTYMSVDVKSNKAIDLTYDGGTKKEKLRKGHYRGRDTVWSKKKIEQKYKTPDRKVTKTWTLRPDGRLLVAVKLNPPKDKSRTFKRVFDRVDAAEMASMTLGDDPASSAAEPATDAEQLNR